MPERRLPKYTVCQDNMRELVPHTWDDGLPMFCVGIIPERVCEAAISLALAEADRFPGSRFVVVGPDGEEVYAAQLAETLTECPF